MKQRLPYMGGLALCLVCLYLSFLFKATGHSLHFRPLFIALVGLPVCLYKIFRPGGGDGDNP